MSLNAPASSGDTIKPRIVAGCNRIHKFLQFCCGCESAVKPPASVSRVIFSEGETEATRHRIVPQTPANTEESALTEQQDPPDADLRAIIPQCHAQPLINWESANFLQSVKSETAAQALPPQGFQNKITKRRADCFFLCFIFY